MAYNGAMSSRRASGKKQRRVKFDYEAMKKVATSDDPKVRKAAFVEYFGLFEEFPSYLFDNERSLDERLARTIQDLLADPETSKAMRLGLEALLRRLPS